MLSIVLVWSGLRLAVVWNQHTISYSDLTSQHAAKVTDGCRRLSGTSINQHDFSNLCNGMVFTQGLYILWLSMIFRRKSWRKHPYIFFLRIWQCLRQTHVWQKKESNDQNEKPTHNSQNVLFIHTHAVI